ncbi:uncharacterized protein SOCE836_028280 [Sorangium cellulosum]|uniref:Uncharacterized protein n=1 Tax=Sorangium cellulosum TaxID=56 RepID=A0A4P2QKZ8_SORCE|nr:uncharacterized protein SOCE836_028280 [Sorangium cellulosum]WCQ90104.1 hypothetical protein NQZ70_02805 [Sorangium sp. Soce836]
MQFSPVVSVSGLSGVGIDVAHCHHWALRSRQGLGPAGPVPVGAMTPKPSTIIATRFLALFFMALSFSTRDGAMLCPKRGHA